VGYTDLFSFKYSGPGIVRRVPDVWRPASGTLDGLQGAQRKMTLERNKSFVGSVQNVLVEGVSKRGDQLFGRTSGNRVVNFPGDPGLIGRLVDVVITRAFQNSLLGEIQGPGSRDR
jgi:tRNA-2-methylthio-N6-dimethylallyladenosine synthase